MNRDSSSALDNILRELGSFAVAFSGGIDSSFLLHRAKSLGIVKVIGVTIRTPYMPASEISEAVTFARSHGIDHHVLDMELPDAIRNNPPDRCYLCKKQLFSGLICYAEKKELKYVIDGTNADDSALTRPGIKAINELHVRSPLAEAGLTKNDIRDLAREAGLHIWNKPAGACLLTRIPYNTVVKGEMLKMIELAEDLLNEYGYPGTRIRCHGDVVRIECLPDYLDRLINDPRKQLIVDELKKIGFRYITLDLEGYRSGSMDPENR